MPVFIQREWEHLSSTWTSTSFRFQTDEKTTQRHQVAAGHTATLLEIEFGVFFEQEVFKKHAKNILKNPRSSLEKELLWTIFGCPTRNKTSKRSCPHRRNSNGIYSVLRTESIPKPTGACQSGASTWILHHFFWQVWSGMFFFAKTSKTWSDNHYIVLVMLQAVCTFARMGPQL